MKDEQEEAKQFSEDLDKVVSGKQAESGQSDEMRRTLEFAHKLESLRSEPSPQFQSRLKQRLLTKIAEQNISATPERSWFARIIRQPVWQTVTAVLVIAIVAGAAWGAGLFRSPQHGENITEGRGAVMTSGTTTFTTTQVAPTTTSMLAAPPPAPGPGAPAVAGALPPALMTSGSTSKASYKIGEAVDITITLENPSPQPVAITEFPPLSIMDSQTNQPVYTFRAVPQTDTINSNSTVSLTYTLNTLSPGKYYLELEDLDLQGQTVKMPFTAPVQFTVY